MKKLLAALAAALPLSALATIYGPTTAVPGYLYDFAVVTSEPAVATTFASWGAIEKAIEYRNVGFNVSGQFRLYYVNDLGDENYWGQESLGNFVFTFGYRFMYYGTYIMREDAIGSWSDSLAYRTPECALDPECAAHVPELRLGAPTLGPVIFDDELVIAVPDPSLSPIPEPSTYALMAAGLGVLGAAGRRRSVAASAAATAAANSAAVAAGSSC